MYWKSRFAVAIITSYEFVTIHSLLPLSWLQQGCGELTLAARRPTPTFLQSRSGSQLNVSAHTSQSIQVSSKVQFSRIASIFQNSIRLYLCVFSSPQNELSSFKHYPASNTVPFLDVELSRCATRLCSAASFCGIRLRTALPFQEVASKRSRFAHCAVQLHSPFSSVLVHSIMLFPSIALLHSMLQCHSISLFHSLAPYQCRSSFLISRIVGITSTFDTWLVLALRIP